MIMLMRCIPCMWSTSISAIHIKSKEEASLTSHYHDELIKNMNEYQDEPTMIKVTTSHQITICWNNNFAALITHFFGAKDDLGKCCQNWKY